MKTSKQQSEADVYFKESYKDMYAEIDRVSGKQFKLWNKFTMWIYSVIFGDKYHLKHKQDDYEKFQSGDAFNEVQEIFSPEPDNSMSEEDIFKNSKKKFRK